MEQHGFACAGLTDDPFRVSAAKTGVLLIKAEKELLVWKQETVGVGF